MAKRRDQAAVNRVVQEVCKDELCNPGWAEVTKRWNKLTGENVKLKTLQSGWFTWARKNGISTSPFFAIYMARGRGALKKTTEHHTPNGREAHPADKLSGAIACFVRYAVKQELGNILDRLDRRITLLPRTERFEVRVREIIQEMFS